MKRLSLCWMLFFCGVTSAAIINVPGDYSNLQEAFNHAGTGDVIRIASGSYSGTGWVNLYFTGKAVTIEGASSSNRPVIDGEGSSVAWTFQEAAAAGCSVRNIVFEDCVGDPVGSLHILLGADITVSGCDIIRGGSAGLSGPSEGGAIRIWKANPVIENCIMIDCFAAQGGGMNILSGCDVIVRNCVIDGCSGSGIQMSTDCSLLIEDSIVSGNTASDISWSAGISCLENSSLMMRRCMVTGNSNTLSDGGGLRVENSTAHVINSFFAGNVSQHLGGGILCKDSSNLTVRFCTMADDTAPSGGSGIASLSNAVVSIYGSIVWEPAGSGLYTATGGSLSVTYSDLYTLMSGAGNFSENPDFVGSGDYHLSGTSICIDAVPGDCEAVDYDGDSRISPCDAGADEYATPVSLEVAIHLPSNNFYPSDPFSLIVSTNNGGDYLYDLRLLVALEVGGQFWFYPAWSSFDSMPVEIKPGYSEYVIISEFLWPEGAGVYSGAHFYAGCTNDEITVVIGNLALEEFGWSE